MKDLFFNQKQKNQIEAFKGFLIEGNSQINLFSRKNFEKQIETLLKESLCSVPLLEDILKNSKEKVLDLGSGNGFPGLVCSILYPETGFILCERNRKKAEFLKSTVFNLQVNNVEILCKNAEDIGVLFKKVLSQATASLQEVLKVLEKILDKEKGEAFLWKTALWEKDWLENSAFSAEVFKSYEIENSKRVLLKVRHFKP